jgi:predicted dehydrogenase
MARTVIASAGGGLLLDLQSHLISTAIDCFGPAQLKYANVNSVRGASDDDVLLVLEHESGVVSSLAVSAISGAPGPRVGTRLGDKGAGDHSRVGPQGITCLGPEIMNLEKVQRHFCIKGKKLMKFPVFLGII